MATKRRPRGRPLSYADKLFRLRWVDRGRPTWPLNDAELSGAQKAAITRDWNAKVHDPKTGAVYFRYRDEANRRYYRALRAEREAIKSDTFRRRYHRRIAAERRAEVQKHRDETAHRRALKEIRERRRIRPRYKDWSEFSPEIRAGVPHPDVRVVGSNYDKEGTLLESDPAAVAERLAQLAEQGFSYMQFLYVVPASDDYPEQVRSRVFYLDRPTRFENERIAYYALAGHFPDERGNIQDWGRNCFSVVAKRGWQRKRA